MRINLCSLSCNLKKTWDSLQSKKLIIGFVRKIIELTLCNILKHTIFISRVPLKLASVANNACRWLSLTVLTVFLVEIVLKLLCTPLHEFIRDYIAVVPRY